MWQTSLKMTRESVVNNQPEVITTTTEVISQENCAKLVGRCFAEATDSDLALVSLGYMDQWQRH